MQHNPPDPNSTFCATPYSSCRKHLWHSRLSLMGTKRIAKKKKKRDLTGNQANPSTHTVRECEVGGGWAQFSLPLTTWALTPFRWTALCSKVLHIDCWQRHYIIPTHGENYILKMCNICRERQAHPYSVSEFCFVGRCSKNKCCLFQEARSAVGARNSSSQVSMNDVTGTERRLSAKSHSLRHRQPRPGLYEWRTLRALKTPGTDSVQGQSAGWRGGEEVEGRARQMWGSIRNGLDILKATLKPLSFYMSGTSKITSRRSFTDQGWLRFGA